MIFGNEQVLYLATLCGIWKKEVLYLATIFGLWKEQVLYLATLLDVWKLYDIYLLTAIGLIPGGSSTVHIYTQTIHRTTQCNTIPRMKHT